MRPSKDAYVTACQQVLALAVVVAVLTPAAGVVSLDVVTDTHPGTAPAARTATSTAAGTRTPGSAIAPVSARVPTAPVDAQVREVALTSAHATPAPDGRLARRTTGGRTELVSAPQAVDGFGTVGVTWDRGATAPTLAVRTRSGDTWSAWQSMAADGEDGPDAGSAEAAQERPGTDPLVVGTVDDVQVRSRSAAGQPADLRLAVVTPGTPAATRLERPALDTGAADRSTDPSSDQSGTQSGTQSSDQGDLSLQAADYTAKPTIYSRAQWGADERLRDASALHYGEVHAGFVHHTVNANDYTAAEVPGILRSIYAYHTRSRGWSDIGYNYLVDRFGRIWEGRYGGIDLDVVGAHTRGYNDDAFAASAIGNYEIAQPSEAVVQAFARLMAWKLSLHGISATGTRAYVTSRFFQAINGHRDAGQTACPGKYLYAQIPRIRTLAASYQAGWAGRERSTDLDGNGSPDIVTKQKSTGRAYVIPVGQMIRVGSAITASARGWSNMDLIVATPDVTGDGRGDVVARVRSTGQLRVYPGDGAGHVGAAIVSSGVGADVTQVTAVGDLDGDGHRDLFGVTKAGQAALFAGDGRGAFTRHDLQATWPYKTTVGVGDFDGDHHRDLVTADGSGRLWLVPGAGRDDRLGTPVLLGSDWAHRRLVAGYGDWNGDGRPDIVARTTTGTYVFPNSGGKALGHWIGPVADTDGDGSISSGGSMVGNAAPDLVVRRGDALLVLQHSGTYGPGAPRQLDVDLTGVRRILSVGDWDRNGKDDLILKKGGGRLDLVLARRAGGWAAPRTIATLPGIKLLAAVGDYTGDGYPDLMGELRGGMRIYPGRGSEGFGSSFRAYSEIPATKNVGVGLWNSGGAPDSMAVQSGQAVLYPGNGPGGLTTPRSLGLDLRRYDWVLGSGDVTGNGHADLIVREKGTGSLWALPGRTSGFGSVPIYLGSGYAGFGRAG